MYLDLKEIGFYFKPNDPFFGECWYSNKTYWLKGFIEKNNYYEQPRLMYSIQYDKIKDLKTNESLIVSKTSISEIFKFINERL